MISMKPKNQGKTANTFAKNDQKYGVDQAKYGLTSISLQKSNHKKKKSLHDAVILATEKTNSNFSSLAHERKAGQTTL